MIPLAIAEVVRTNLITSNDVKVLYRFTSMGRDEECRVTRAFFEKKLKEEKKGEGK